MLLSLANAQLSLSYGIGNNSDLQMIQTRHKIGQDETAQKLSKDKNNY